METFISYLRLLHLCE